MNNKEILDNIDNYDSSEYIEPEENPATENKTSKKHNRSESQFFGSLFESINDYWDKLTESIIKFLKKKKKVSYEKSEDDKHKKLFNLIMKYFMLMIVLAMVVILVVAFFKVYVFSSKITQHTKRTEVKEISGVDFNIDSTNSWENKSTEDIENNNKNIQIIKESLDKQSKEYEKGVNDIKKLISNSSLDTIKRVHANNEEFKKSLYSYVDERNNDTVKKLSEKIDAIPKHSNLSGSFLKIPNNVKTVVDKTVKYVDGVISDTNGSSGNTKTSTKETKSTKDTQRKKQIERDKKIFMSINIESVNSDTTGYDAKTNEKEKDQNETLPPIILRQGLSNGVLITGISAPTFEVDNSPSVVMLTFKGDSIISNMFEQDVENCTATGSVFGNIITRRAEVLVNKISCTFKENGKQYMVRANVKAWVFDGYDGRLGIPGIMVDNAGAIINDSILIGLLQGMGTFVAGTAQAYASQGQNTLSTNGQPTFNPGQIAATGVAGGLGKNLSSGFDTVTGYYQKIIDTLYPYIDVKGGRKISIFFDGGEILTPVEYRPFMVADHKNENGKEYDDDMEVEVDNNEW